MPQKLSFPQYDTFSAVRSHLHTNGLAMMAAAGVYPSLASVVALHGGMDYDLVVYIASRRGEPPVIPSPTTNNPNRVFLNGGRIGEFPIQDIMGVTRFTVQGWLVFGILSPEGLASDFMLGNLPFPGLIGQMGSSAQCIEGTYFQYGLINDALTQKLQLQTGITNA